MSTDLVSNDDVLSLVVDNPYENELKEILTAGTWLPRLQLFISNSEAVKSEQIGMNHYGLVVGKDQIEDLGREVDVLLITIRPRALDTSDRDNIRASSDRNSELFQEIKDTADTVKGKSGCIYGPEFLIYVPSRKVFASLLMGSATSRNEAGRIGALMFDEETKKRKITPVTLKSKPIKNSEFTWQGIMATRCSTPFELPLVEDINKVADVFLHPKEITGLEKVKVNEQQITRPR